MKQGYKTLLLWLLLGVMLVAIYQITTHDQGIREVAFSHFVSDVQNERVERVQIEPSDDSSQITYWLKVTPEAAVAAAAAPATGTPRTGAATPRRRGVQQMTVGVIGDALSQQLLANRVVVQYQRAEQDGVWTSILVTWVPMLLLMVIFFMFMRQIQASGGKAMSFGKSRARLLNESQNKITFADVAGVDEAKDDCEEIIAFLKDPKKFQRLGGRIPKGVLLMGSPGTGKTLLARAIAGEAGVPFFSISGSDFVEMFVGVGASRVRDLFEQGKKNAPCIIFIDEIDAVGRHRGAGMGGGHDEREQTLNQLLVEMDGFESSEGVIIVAATNRPDVLDPAILRPGRFDRRIVVARPDIGGRIGILQVHTRKVPVAEDVDLEVIARGTPGFSGADLENLVNEGALLAARQDKDFVSMSDFEMAKDKVLMGSERRSMVLSEKEKRNTAVHESGHAVVGHMLKNNDPIHKVTIIPRGRALGLTLALPASDPLGYSRDQIEDRIAMILGGRIAEQIIFDQVTTGASDDLKKATSFARSMVTEWGMSEKLGTLAYVESEESGFLGSSHHKEYSEATAKEIDDEVRRIVAEQYARAHEVLTAQRDKLLVMSDALLDRETLDREEVEAIMSGNEMPERQRIIIPTYAEKRKDAREKRKGNIFQPRPREIPSAG